MLKTVTFLVFILTLWGCAQGRSVSDQNHHEKHNKIPSWMRTCGHSYKDHRLNITSIVRGKMQKISLLEVSSRFMHSYLMKLNRTTQVIEGIEHLNNLLHVKMNVPQFANRSLQGVHIDLQIYIALFDRIAEEKKEKEFIFEHEKNEELNELNLLREHTHNWLCIVEDMLNGTDRLRMKTLRHLQVHFMKKKINRIIGQKQVDYYFRGALKGIENYAKDFYEFVQHRHAKLTKQLERMNKRHNSLLKDKRKCLRKNNCKSRLKKNAGKRERQLMKLRN